MPHISHRTVSILALLNNINDLIVESSNREKARDVMRALVVYAKEKRFRLPEEKIENFYAILLDSKPYTLTSLIKDIAQSVIATNQN